MERRIFSDKGFYIGDISYALVESLYDEIWGAKYNYESSLEGFVIPKNTITGNELLHKDYKFLVHSTYNEEDGFFMDSVGRGYSVETSVIGILPLEICIKEGSNGPIEQCGTVVEGAGMAELFYDNGTFVITIFEETGEILDTFSINTRLANEDDDFFDPEYECAVCEDAGCVECTKGDEVCNCDWTCDCGMW